MVWHQRTLTLEPLRRGFHLISSEVIRELPELADLRVGLLNIFIQHTSASLTINENASPEVATDLESSINSIVREDFPYRHSLEGPDDMPAHVKSSLFGPSLTVPIRDGRLAMGVWQGIFLCEHRDRGGPRRIVLTLQGE